MFPLHDRTRRFLCRVIFLSLGLLPTISVLAWSISVNSASHLAAVRTRLEDALGLRVQIEKVGYPRPGSTLLTGLELADPETGAPLLRARLVEMWGDEHCQTWIALQPQIDLTHADRLWKLIENQLRRRPDSNQSALRIAAAELTLRSPSGLQTLVDCSGQFDAVENSRSVATAFRLAETLTSEPMRLRIERSNQSPDGPTTSLKLNTAGAPLPCSLIAALMRHENPLGAPCTFRGSINAAEAPDGWHCQFSGKLENIDLHAAISEQFSHQLNGSAELKFDHGVFHSGRLEQLEGAIHAGQGTISPSMLAAAVQWLNLRSSSAFFSVEQLVPFDELSARFALDSKGLVIRGQCENAVSGTIICSRTTPLLFEQAGPPVPVVALVSALVPDSRVQVPATRQTDWLLRLLPVPDVLPRDPQVDPQARLRNNVGFRK